MMDIHTELTREVKDAELRADDSKALKELEERMNELRREKDAVVGEAREREMKVGELEAKLTAIQDEVLALKERKAQIMAANTGISPKVENALSMFSEVSCIEWDFASDNVKGIVASKDGTVTKPFNLDATKHSMFFITNYLWETIPGH